MRGVGGWVLYVVSGGVLSGVTGRVRGRSQRWCRTGCLRPIYPISINKVSENRARVAIAPSKRFRICYGDLRVRVRSGESCGISVLSWPTGTKAASSSGHRFKSKYASRKATGICDQYALACTAYGVLRTENQRAAGTKGRRDRGTGSRYR